MTGGLALDRRLVRWHHHRILGVQREHRVHVVGITRGVPVRAGDAAESFFDHLSVAWSTAPDSMK